MLLLSFLVWVVIMVVNTRYFLATQSPHLLMIWREKNNSEYFNNFVSDLQNLLSFPISLLWILCNFSSRRLWPGTARDFITNFHSFLMASRAWSSNSPTDNVTTCMCECVSDSLLWRNIVTFPSNFLPPLEIPRVQLMEKHIIYKTRRKTSIPGTQM